MCKNNDVVNHPEHYQSATGVECIQAIESATDGLSGIEAVCTGNAIKYLWRWKKKNGLEDLKKAQWYINRVIDKYEKRSREKHGWVVQLNDKFMTEYEEETGYNDFGDLENAYLFESADSAMTALVDVVWGGTDNPPEIIEV